MPVRSCRVTITDLEGVAHSVSITAGTLYEAVALGLAAIRRDDWVVGIPEGLNTVKVRVSDVSVEHSVKLADSEARETIHLFWLSVLRCPSPPYLCRASSR